MDWNEIVKDVISGSILLAIGGGGGWLAGLFKGKKESSEAVERKNGIYQPLLDEVEKYSFFGWNIIEKIEMKRLGEVVTNSYKYALTHEIQNKCNHLYEVVKEYNSIDVVRVAHGVIADIFRKGYEEIYGSVIDGVVHNSNREGSEWDEEIIAEPVQVINHLNVYTRKEIENLLKNEGFYSDEVCIDEENALYEPIYLQLKRIYASALRVVINGERYILPKSILDLNMLPEEYMAYQYDFFKLYNNDEKIIKKNKLYEEIVYSSQSVVQELKEIIYKIVRNYEVENI